MKMKVKKRERESIYDRQMFNLISNVQRPLTTHSEKDNYLIKKMGKGYVQAIHQENHYK